MIFIRFDKTLEVFYRKHINVPEFDIHICCQFAGQIS